MMKEERFASSSAPWLLLLLLLFLLSYLHPSHCTSHAFPPLKLLDMSASPSPTILLYHNGPLLSGSDPINLYLLWYGTFSDPQKSIVTDFLSTFASPVLQQSPTRSVSFWWKPTSRYTDMSHLGVSSSVLLKTQALDAYSLGRKLLKSDIATLVEHAFARNAFLPDPRSIYFVFTSDDVYVDDFCMSSCGFHDHTSVSPPSRNQSLLYAWVGNSAKQCPGQCAWPFAPPQFGPRTVLLPPNGDVGMDGMIINIATILAGAATNPFDTGYFQGDAAAPAEAVSACTGIFGNGAYPGYPGALLVNKTAGVSYNAKGVNNRLFLLPGMWDPSTNSCTTLS